MADDDLLTLEKMRIHERLVDLEKKAEVTNLKLIHAIDNQTVVLEGIRGMLEEHHVTLFGKNGNLGLNKIVDRLHQKEEVREWSIKAVWVALIGLAAKATWDIFSKGAR